jgi:5-formyltetrahydrofolate cyclo-ligase
MKIESKTKIRKEFLEKRKGLDKNFILEASSKICKKVSSLPFVSETKLLCGYYPICGEPKIMRILEAMREQGAKIFLPKYLPPSKSYTVAAVANFADLRPGKFGIHEPAGTDFPAEKDFLSMIWLVPGIAFDVDGNRIGFGGGTYDRLLKQSSGEKIGICYQLQVLNRIVPNRDDVKMDHVITEEKIYNCKKNKKQ